MIPGGHYIDFNVDRTVKFTFILPCAPPTLNLTTIITRKDSHQGGSDISTFTVEIIYPDYFIRPTCVLRPLENHLANHLHLVAGGEIPSRVVHRPRTTNVILDVDSVPQAHFDVSYSTDDEKEEKDGPDYQGELL